MDTNRIPNKHYNINQKDEGTWDDRGTTFILRIKEQETRLTHHEHDDDDKTHFSRFFMLAVMMVMKIQVF